jgi:uncharacterized protein
MLSTEEETALEQELTNFTEKTGNEFAVVTVPTYGTDETIETYATKLFEEWQIGKEKSDNGLLLLIARDNREARIEVGYGLEGAVTDIESAHVISDVLAPAFQAGNYGQGIESAVLRLMDDAENGAPLEPSPKEGVNVGDFGPLIFFFFIFLSSVLARSKSWWGGGLVGALLGWIFLSSLLWIAVFCIVGLAFDYAVSKNYQRHRGRGTIPPWWLGGPPRGGMGGGGFGGFGGGSSGGGGASGRW